MKEILFLGYAATVFWLGFVRDASSFENAALIVAATIGYSLVLVACDEHPP